MHSFINTVKFLTLSTLFTITKWLCCAKLLLLYNMLQGVIPLHAELFVNRREVGAYNQFISIC